MNETHDPRLKSWVESANVAGTDFPIQNLPFGVFKPGRVGVAIGDQILDLYAAGIADCLSNLNPILDLGPNGWSLLRRDISRLLRRDAPHRERTAAAMIPLGKCEMMLPFAIGDYTDFYASLFHATNVGKLFRPDNPLLPNYKYVPIGYHGRASSVVVSGTDVKRPLGQRPGPPPTFGPSQKLDYEVELGWFVGQGNELGQPFPISQAANRTFGFCLLNDWSARDIQAWEYQPLGPFLGKSFATTISPWVVTQEALEPFRSPAFARAHDDPAPLRYLTDEEDRDCGGLDITLEVWLNGTPLSRGNTRDLYWTIAQMMTHHASNGCNLRPGDLMASGTVSGDSLEARGCLLERGGPFLVDGDEVVIRGRCEREGWAAIGFGECRGRVMC